MSIREFEKCSEELRKSIKSRGRNQVNNHGYTYYDYCSWLYSVHCSVYTFCTEMYPSRSLYVTWKDFRWSKVILWEVSRRTAFFIISLCTWFIIVVVINWRTLKNGVFTEDIELRRMCSKRIQLVYISCM